MLTLISSPALPMPLSVVRSCPTPDAKVRVLKEMIFPNCEKLGQTIIFVRTQVRKRARAAWAARSLAA